MLIEGNIIIETGEALGTQFEVKCEDWQSGSAGDIGVPPSPLTYRFLTLTNNATPQLLYVGSQGATPCMRLGIGDADNDYLRDIRVEVTYSYGASAQVQLKVKVRTWAFQAPIFNYPIY